MMSTVTNSSSRLALPDALTTTRGVVLMPPDEDSGALMPVLEVLVQEGLTAIALPCPRSDETADDAGADTPQDPSAELTGLMSMYSFRATVGIHGVRTTADAQLAIRAGARFAFCLFPEPGVLDALRVASIPAIVTALTPTEVEQAWQGAVSAVHVRPAEVFGTGYAQGLHELVPGASLIATAQNRAAVEAWLRAGATAVSFGQSLLSRVFLSQDYSALRQRVAEMVSAVKSS